jgi:hypothetical protein
MKEQEPDRFVALLEQNQIQLDKMQLMMEQLITMVGNNNAVTEELRQDMNLLKTRFDTLESKVDCGFTDVVAMINLIGKKVENIPRIEAKLDALNDRTFEHEADIRLLKKAL